MLVLKIAICIFTIILFVLVRIKHENNCETTWLLIFSSVLGIVFCILLIATNFNFVTIIKILSFISICLFIILKKKEKPCIPSLIFAIIAVLTIIILIFCNLEKGEILGVYPVQHLQNQQRFIFYESIEERHIEKNITTQCF